MEVDKLEYFNEVQVIHALEEVFDTLSGLLSRQEGKE